MIVITMVFGFYHYNGHHKTITLQWSLQVNFLKPPTVFVAEFSTG